MDGELTLGLRAKGVVAVVRTQVVDLDHDLVRPGVVGGQFPTDAAGVAGAGAWVAAVDGLGDGRVVAAVAVPGTGYRAGIIAG